MSATTFHTSEAKQSRRRFLGLLGAFLGTLTLSGSTQAAPALIGKPKGRPRIVIDRVALPPGTPALPTLVNHLQRTLRHEARRANWGAGRGSTIALRFAVEHLDLEPRGNVLRVRCSAQGELPRRRTARSQLTYTGARSQSQKVVLEVLDIVARGVIHRLAELERTRRGATA